MPAKQLSPLCEFEVHLSPNILGLSVLPLHALPFTLLQSMVQRCSCGAALPGLYGCVQKPQGQGSRETALLLQPNVTPEPATMQPALQRPGSAPGLWL